MRLIGQMETVVVRGRVGTRLTCVGRREREREREWQQCSEVRRFAGSSSGWREGEEKAVAALAGLTGQSDAVAAWLQGGHALLITPQGRPWYPTAHAPPITGRWTRCQTGG